MGERYNHLSLTERHQIGVLRTSAQQVTISKPLKSLGK